MIPLITLLTIITLSIIAIRIGAVALELTGLSAEVASFQAQSAFSGVGFTTAESEGIVNHPVRRRIIRILILLGSAGITSSMATLVLTFLGRSSQQVIVTAEVLFIGLILIILFARSKIIKNVMRNIIKRALEKWTTLALYDYEQLFGLSKGFTISRIVVSEGNWLANRKLKDLKLEQEGVLVLSVYQTLSGEEKYIGIPTGETEIHPHDTVICYARGEVSQSLSHRSQGNAGDEEHHEKVKEEQKLSQIRELKGGYE